MGPEGGAEGMVSLFQRPSFSLLRRINIKDQPIRRAIGRRQVRDPLLVDQHREQVLVFHRTLHRTKRLPHIGGLTGAGEKPVGWRTVRLEEWSDGREKVALGKKIPRNCRTDHEGGQRGRRVGDRSGVERDRRRGKSEMVEWWESAGGG